MGPFLQAPIKLMCLVFNVLFCEYLGFLFDFTSEDTLRIFAAYVMGHRIGVSAFEEP